MLLHPTSNGSVLTLHLCRGAGHWCSYLYSITMSGAWVFHHACFSLQSNTVGRFGSIVPTWKGFQQSVLWFCDVFFFFLVCFSKWVMIYGKLYYFGVFQLYCWCFYPQRGLRHFVELRSRERRVTLKLRGSHQNSLHEQTQTHTHISYSSCF